MKIICAWCGRELKELVKSCIAASVISLPSGIETSHGICRPCAEKVLQEYEKNKHEVKKC